MSISSGSGLRIRQNVLNLSAAQQTKFVNALLSLKSNGKYDSYVTLHASAIMHSTPAPGDPLANATNPAAAAAYRNATGSGPAFFPWHREFVLRLERDLAVAMAEPGFAMPYWNWAADSGATPPASSSIWGPTLMGGDGDPANSNRVRTGPFRSVLDGGTWTTVEMDANGKSLPSSFLRRTLGRGASLAGAPLPSPAKVNASLALTPYDVADFSSASASGFRSNSEGSVPFGMNNLVRAWIGGSMALATAPNDPVFFLHYCNMDRLWNFWQSSKAGGFGRGYVPISKGPAGHNLTDPMFPWTTATDTVTPADTVNSLTLGYKYDTD
jgi:tyrosinase